MMKNKLGVADYGMDVWDGGCFNLAQRLELLKSCGIDGIEMMKAPEMGEAIQNASTFHRMGMDFATCKMTAPEQTFKATSAFGKEYVWLDLSACTRDVPFDRYCRRANAFVKAASAYGIKVALHNHLGLRVENQQEIDDFMTAVPGAMLLLDVGHLFAADGDCVEVIRKYHDRLAAVHFKDVFYKDKSISLETWWERLRFCELNGGNAGMKFEPIAKALRDAKYDKWVLIEHDTHLQSPEIDLKKSADILRELFA